MTEEKKLNCQTKDCGAEVYQDNLCANCYDKKNPNIKGWKCDICQRLCKEDEQFTTIAEKMNSNDPKVAEEFRKKYPYGITYCPECKTKADEEAKEVPKETKDKEENEDQKKSLCQSCQNSLNEPTQDWEKNRQRIKAEAVKCDGHNSTSIRYYNTKRECIGSQYKGSAHTIMPCKSCGEGSVERSAWCDYPPCSLCINSENNNQLEENNQEPEPTKLEKFDDKLPDKIKPTKIKKIEPEATKLLSLDQVEEYFIRESISKIERKDGRLIITFTDEKSIDKNTLTIKEQQKLNQFLTTSNLKELSREELDNRLRPSYKSTNKDHARGGIPASAWWFVGGCVFILLAVGIVWKIIKGQKKSI